MNCKCEGGTYMNNRKYIDEYSGKEKSKRYLRFKKQKRKEIKFINNSGNICKPFGIDWSDYYREWVIINGGRDRFFGNVYDLEFGKIIPCEKAYPKRYYRGKCSRILKNYSHRKVRRTNFEYIGKSNISNREYDYWWELY